MPTVDLTTLVAYKDKQLLRVQSHPTLPLQIWNYSQVVQAKKGPWDEITTMCRGLVVDRETSEIVARAFPKFWNNGERKEEIDSKESHAVFEKLDGSLGILFYYRGQWIISSRGSFVSDQSAKATELLAKYNLEVLDTSLTYVLEIIYPQNRIVVDYGDLEALYFLSAFRTTGEEVLMAWESARAAGFPLCPVFPEYADMTLTHLQALNLPNREGFVVRYDSGFRLKVKFASYLDLHRTATVSSSMVFDAFCAKEPLADVLERTPDEFHPWVTEQWQKIRQGYDAILEPLKEEHTRLVATGVSQKEFAAAIMSHPQKGILFLLWGNRDPFQAVCKYMTPPPAETKWRPAGAHRAPPPPFEQVITFMIGVAGSGKSTYARSLTVATPKTVMVSRDLLRQSFSVENYYESPLLQAREEWVTESQHAQIRAAHAARFHVIVDDTNLTVKAIKGIMERHSHAVFRYHVMDTPVEVAIERSTRRVERVVSPSVIRSQQERLNVLRPQLEKLFEVKPVPVVIEKQKDLPSAIVVDLDGTLAHMTGRNAYDHTRVEEDEIDEVVHGVMRAVPYVKVLCSGRGEEAKEGTVRWLTTHGVEYVELHMRKKGDVRPDTVVKEEMWRELATRYRVECLLDDRQSVVDHGRRLGLKVWQVAEGNF